MTLPLRRFVNGLSIRLAPDCSGVALTEFAFALPVLLTLGLYGLESANLALINMKVSQIASNLADTTSRIGLDSPLAAKQIRESDINDAFQAVRLQGGNYNITTNGRVILSSLEQNASGGQWIHWQRCVGMGNFLSSYGKAGDGVTGTALVGMGPKNSEIKAPPQQAVMFVEIAYTYQPLVSSRLFGTPVIRSTASFIVRDIRDLTDADNPSNPSPGATKMTCDKFTT
jgi:Flp pilus assembly protein TadG